MKYAIIWLIKIYRLLIPAETRRKCLFKESCSSYVERIALNKGSFAAFHAFFQRFRSCRPGYSFEITYGPDCWELVCADGSAYKKNMVSRWLQREVLSTKKTTNSNEFQYSGKRRWRQLATPV